MQQEELPKVNTNNIVPQDTAFVPQDYELTLEEYQKSAQQGHAYAQFNLGAMYYQGKGVKQDYEKSIGIVAKKLPTKNMPKPNSVLA